ncbi:MAG: surface layer protein, partial [Oscillibacter sp.]|nr:surface layer protein [Oscillibacter sp.]
MKRKQLRSAAALLAAIMLLSPAGAFASEALGEDLAAKDVLLNEKTMLSTNVFWSTSQSDLRTENLVTYAPSEAVTPMVTYGAALTERMSVAEAARSLEAKGYRVVAGVNGDFYNTSNGLPVGIVISDGILRSTDAGYYAIGFCGDGSVMIGKPAVQISADLGYQMTDSANYATQVVRRIAAVNKVRNNGGIFLYTYDFNDKHTTGTTEDGVNVVCRVIEGEIAVGQTVTAVVERVAQSAFEPIGEGQFVLSVNANADAYFVQGLLGETEGNLVTLTISGGDGWENVREALGALYLLAEDGAVTRGLPADANPRTAIGLRA